MDPNTLHTVQAGIVIAIVKLLADMGLPPIYRGIAATIVGAVIVTAGMFDPRINDVLIGLAAAGLVAVVGKIGGSSTPDAPPADAAPPVQP